MRILYLADIRLPLERANGIQTMETCHALARRGHDVTLLVRPDTRTPARDPLAFYGLPPLERFTIARVPVRGRAELRRAHYLVAAFRLALRKSRWDVVFTRDLGFASLLLRWPRRRRPPVIYESHGYAPVVAGLLPELLSSAPSASRAKARRLAARERRVWKQADGYVTITAALAEDLRERLGDRRDAIETRGRFIDVGTEGGSRDISDSGSDGARDESSGGGRGSGSSRAARGGGAPDDRALVDAAPAIAPAVVPDGVRLPPDRQFTWSEPSPQPVVVYAGHLYPWKGVDTLIAALAHARALRARIIGGMPGEADLDRLRTLAQDAGVADRVEFTGLLPPHAVAAELATADALVLPNRATSVSAHYTSPLKLFEYLAAGRPIVASDLPALREVLHHGENAWLTAPDDAAALGAGLLHVLGDPALARRLARRAFDAAAEYSWDRRAERLEAVLDAAVRSATRSGTGAGTGAAARSRKRS